MKKLKDPKYDKLVDIIYLYIKDNNSELFNTYQFRTKNQKFTLKEIISACFIF